MTNVQLLLAAGLPTLSVVVGVLLNNRLLSECETDINKRFDQVEKRLDFIEDDMRNYRITTRLESRVEVLERRS